ncbi:YsnF/AvaK domain-containing protein [Hymenobacter sp. BT491]|uniref:YsnF/AvaK domain-containing protein n=1 Tax=Hymenobacter sp. BT491 TaxID=2766779 RepID=UPI00165389FC|nr:YsnF/AvaK domain-containing protein [Hymenobacter sp. BT491]MBC6991048.1 YsnF/AvaK domain-containing protein [Hymenobacter sp. BT491]
MAHTVVGMFDSAAEAQQAAQQLQAAGFSLDNIDVASQSGNRYGANSTSGSGSGVGGDASDYRNSSGTAVEGAADAVGRTADRTGNAASNALRPDRDPSDYQNTSGTATEGVADAAGRTGDSISNFFSNLFGGDDNDDTKRYSQVARRAGSIVTVHADSAERAHQAAKIMDDAGAVDVDERAAQYGYQSQGNSLNTTAQAGNAEGGMKAQVIEENLQVGKRVEQTGGARLRSRIVERPVEANVRLREEHVTVQRNPVDRPATDADFAAFKEGDVEITESAERAVVGKEARVVEEVSLGKEVTEREETIRDTVRKTEVDVEKLDGGTTPRTDDPNQNSRV